MTSVLYDVPGPRARVRNLLLNVIGLAIIAAVGWYVYRKFDETGQWASEKWKPFTDGDIWTNFILPGIGGTLKAAALAGVLAMVFGLVFAVGRMSSIKPIAWASATVIEFFRAVPLLIMMIFLWLAPTKLFDQPANVFMAVVVALMLYNGAVIAEVIRAGVQALPRGQGEAGLSVGLTSGQTMRAILLPQALRSMLPAIIAQLVVLLKDSALGYIIGYAELLRQANNIATSNNNVVQSMIVIAAIFIAINLTLGALANWVERRTRKTGHTAGPVGEADVVPPAPGMTGAAV
jgi:glutamate transport system permease protein